MRYEIVIRSGIPVIVWKDGGTQLASKLEVELDGRLKTAADLIERLATRLVKKTAKPDEATKELYEEAYKFVTATQGR